MEGAQQAKARPAVSQCSQHTDPLRHGQTAPKLSMAGCTHSTAGNRPQKSLCLPLNAGSAQLQAPQHTASSWTHTAQYRFSSCRIFLHLQDKLPKSFALAGTTVAGYSWPHCNNFQWCPNHRASSLPHWPYLQARGKESLALRLPNHFLQRFLRFCNPSASQHCDQTLLWVTIKYFTIKRKEIRLCFCNFQSVFPDTIKLLQSNWCWTRAIIH